MHYESRLFLDEWWKPSWPRLELPPAPSRAARRRLGAKLGSRLTAAQLKPLPFPTEDEMFMLEEYPERLCRQALKSRMNATSRQLRTFVFTHMRQYTIRSITDKLLYVENELMDPAKITEDLVQECVALLHQQAEAVRDFEYMTHRTEPGFDQTIDHEGQMEAQHRFAELGGLERLAIQQRSVLHITPLWATSRLHNILKRVLPPDLTYSTHERWSLREHYASGAIPLQTSLAVKMLGSGIVAMTGGAFLIVPTAIMAYNDSREAKLLTTSLSVLVFAFSIAAFVAARSSETFLATATYAAVLVVFFGATSASSPMPAAAAVVPTNPDSSALR